MKVSGIPALVALSLIATTSFAEVHYGVGLGASTLGASGTFSARFNPYFGITANANYVELKHTVHDNLAHYHGDFNFASLDATANYHPFAGHFHISAGLVTNENKIKVDATPVNDTITIHNQTFSLGDVGGFSGEISGQRKFQPYAGIGWNANNGEGFGVYSDIGMAYQGRAVVDASTNIVPTGVIGQQVREAVNAAKAKLQSELDKFGNWYPVVRFGVSYTF